MGAPGMTDTGFMRAGPGPGGGRLGPGPPQPLVGAVVVRDGVVVGEGAHREFGGPHAEVEALAAGDAARGATLYVTLEPCAHHGKTPPCTDAILAAGIRPGRDRGGGPESGGRGWRRQAPRRGPRGDRGRAAGRGPLSERAVPAPPGARPPFVALKFGLSLDGRIARAEGERTRITGPEAEAEVHRLRAGFDAIMVGGRTARIDDPLLTARGAVTPRVPPVRVVVSARADVPRGRAAPVLAGAGARLAGDGRQRPGRRRRAGCEDRGVRVLVVAPDTGGDGSLDPARS
jgi:diaminohydroxyphosphoribosylaminopyrimidine deaminase / 5-amino-6-(5-phosphoribosylamino)uracil reductase